MSGWAGVRPDSVPGSGARLGKGPSLSPVANPLRALLGQWGLQTCQSISTVPWGWAETSSHKLFPTDPTHTFMALKSLSAKYSEVLRIHFTEKREGEVELFWLPWTGLGRHDPFLFSPLGDHEVQTQDNPGS